MVAVSFEQNTLENQRDYLTCVAYLRSSSAVPKDNSRTDWGLALASIRPFQQSLLT